MNDFVSPFPSAATCFCTFSKEHYSQRNSKEHTGAEHISTPLFVTSA